MNDKKPYEINADKLLVISDIHQDCDFFKAVLEREKGNYDHILFLGDMIDSYWGYPRVYTAKETAKFIVELQNGAYGPASFAQGNHDTPARECFSFNKKFSNKKHIFNRCSGFTNSKSIDFNKEFELENWQRFHLFYTYGDYLLSHAGLNPRFWNFYKTTEENLDTLWAETEEALALISVAPNKHFGAGFGRGGTEPTGGLIWQDWDTEFVDGVPLKQICGHSSYGAFRNVGENWCIDTTQSGYILIDKNGIIEFKSIVQDEVTNLWKDQKPLFRDDTEFKQTISKNFK